MNDKTNSKVTLCAEPITIPAAQFSRLLRAAVHLSDEAEAYLRREDRSDAHGTEEVPAICENCKKASGGDSRLVDAERCIGDIEHVLYGVEDYVAAVENVRNLIGVWRKEREAK